jgi:hypothetical protein
LSLFSFDFELDARIIIGSGCEGFKSGKSSSVLSFSPAVS